MLNVNKTSYIRRVFFVFITVNNITKYRDCTVIYLDNNDIIGDCCIFHNCKTDQIIRHKNSLFTDKVGGLLFILNCH